MYKTQIILTAFILFIIFIFLTNLSGEDVNCNYFEGNESKVIDSAIEKRLNESTQHEHINISLTKYSQFSPSFPISFINSLNMDVASTDEQNCLITYPLNYDVLRAGDDIAITGNITGEDFVSYSVEYGVGLEPTEWYDDDIILTDGGQYHIINDVIAVWNTSSIVEPGFYTLKITVNSNEQKIFYVKDLHLDPTLKQGWPQRIPWYKEYDPELNETVRYFGGAAQPVLTDIDNDNETEIIVYVAGNPTRIYAYNPDGTLVEGWPVYVGQERMPGGELEAPAIGDLDGNGWKEVIVNGKMGLYAYNHDGSFRFNISFVDLCAYQFRPLSVPSSVVLFDLDNDGAMEIIKKFRNHSDHFEKIVVFNSTGGIVDGWPQNIYRYKTLCGDKHIETSTFGLTQSIGNFDEDDKWEIIVGTVRNEYEDINDPEETFHHEGRVYVFNHDGSVVDGFPVDIDGEIAWSSPVVADIDNDGYEDIIIGTRMEDDYPERRYSNPNTGLYVIDRSGEVKSGWPQLRGKSIYTTPAIADFNNDGRLEIVVSTYNVNRFDWVKPQTYVFNSWGEILPGWPQETVWNDYHSPVVADITCDGSLDIVVSAGNGVVDADGNQPGHGGVYAWNIDGSMIEGFPKVTEPDAQAAPCIGDIDNDGVVEVVASSMYDMDNLETGSRKARSSLYVWEIGSPFNDSTLHWPMYSHDPGFSGRYIGKNVTNHTPMVRFDGDIRCPTKPFIYGHEELFSVTLVNDENQEVDASVVFWLWDSSTGEWEFFGESNCIISPGSSNITDPNDVFLNWPGRIWEIEKIRAELYVDDELVDTQENRFFLWFFII
jgi:hypothetical protein